MIDQNFVINTQIQNRLLNALPAKELKRFIPKLKEVDLKFGTNIYDRGDAIEHVYFPTGSVTALLAVGSEDLTLEIGMIGKEGVVGLPVFLGAAVADCRAVVQADGTALRMASTDFAIECRQAETLREMLLRFAKLRMVQTSLASACHRFHDIEKRLVRWILMTSDRIENSEIRVTHDFLTNILGERPDAVTEAAERLAKKDLISYSHNRLVIPDRSLLEAAACRCYKLIRSEETNSMALH